MSEVKADAIHFHFCGFFYHLGHLSEIYLVDVVADFYVMLCVSILRVAFHVSFDNFVKIVSANFQIGFWRGSINREVKKGLLNVSLIFFLDLRPEDRAVAIGPEVDVVLMRNVIEGVKGIKHGISQEWFSYP